MSHVVLKPSTSKPPDTSRFYDAAESLWMSFQRSLSTGKDNNAKSKKYARGLFY